MGGRIDGAAPAPTPRIRATGLRIRNARDAGATGPAKASISKSHRLPGNHRFQSGPFISLFVWLPCPSNVPQINVANLLVGGSWSLGRLCAGQAAYRPSENRLFVERRPRLVTAPLRLSVNQPARYDDGAAHVNYASAKIQATQARG